MKTSFVEIARRIDAIARSNYVVGVCTPIALGEMASLSVEVDVSRLADRENGSGEGETEGRPKSLVVRHSVQYSVAHLTGATQACDPDDIALERLSCLDPSDCELACIDRECGIDKNTICGTCESTLACSDEGQCL